MASDTSASDKTAAPRAVPAPVFELSVLGIAAPEPAREDRPSVSVVTPMYNEEGAAATLITEIAAALAGRQFEILAVDDASTDRTVAALAALRGDIPQLRVLRHDVNAGQSRGVRTGVLAAQADVIATLDGDGQNNPADIPALIDALTESTDPGLAMIGGERQKRQDSQAKKVASRWANRIRSRLLRDGAKDTGCGLKVFYREAYLRLPYFDHAHRYIPALMRREGFAVEYLPVSHRPRVHGASKYTNWGRLLVALRDILGVLWLNDRARSPIAICELSEHDECAKDNGS